MSDRRHLQIAPSILTSDFTRLGETLEMLNSSQCDYIHLDVMDGVFVPNISFGFPVIRNIAKKATKPLDVHLMIVDPDRYIGVLRDAAPEYVTVHYEACTHLHRSLQNIRANGMKAGVVLNPHTPVSSLEYIAEFCDMVVLMSVNPGFGGQSFIEGTYRKVAETKELLLRTGSHALIEIDGGVNLTNAGALRDAGADVVVTGNAVFASEDPIATVELFKSI